MTKYVCRKCGCDRCHVSMWVVLGTNEVLDAVSDDWSRHSGNTYCPTCHENCDLVTAEEYAHPD